VEASARTVRFAIMDAGVEPVAYNGGIIDVTDSASVSVSALR
jgi:hypothetical protein